MATTSLGPAGRAAALLVALAASPAAAQASGPVAYRCTVTESFTATTASGTTANPNYRSYELILQYGPKVFKILNTETNRWSDNYCWAVNDYSTPQCRFDNVELSAKWTEGSQESPPIVGGRGVDLYLSTYFFYRIDLAGQGSPRLWMNRRKVVTQVHPYVLDDYGHKRWGPSAGPTPTWAAYTLVIDAVGPCVRAA